MKIEYTVSKIMSTGTKISLLLMAAGLLMSLMHNGTAPSLFAYAAVTVLISTSALSLVYFMFYFFYNNEKNYAVICLLIVLFLAGVTAFKVFS